MCGPEGKALFSLVVTANLPGKESDWPSSGTVTTPGPITVGKEATGIRDGQGLVT